ncbi:1,4-dihydroxy-2-naphthoate octaprenyltransferase [Parashewanella curva]|uniref:1,4-dihydroxy-2-naphthoate octaprenyltransferase n=1 Tax=Parashewanella curva TaxID=2338552 RepID=A0A3L8PW99_9GAMM|nr:1,4-dihydroxy-2-naphthoate octaprenyltransferase [Parashewanella curva]RLV59727.1 1,4-dihydroxy-2-naphthoate octaprenyltransferase [Parashewanella curva]
MNPWIIAIRPKTLFAAISPIILGNTMAASSPYFEWSIAILSLVCGVFLQITVNLVNDYSDHKNGIDSQQRLGPIRACQSGIITPNTMVVGISISTLLSILSGLFLVFHGGIGFLYLGVASIACAFAYSLGSKSLANLALGELAVFIFFGLIAVCGSYYLQSHALNTDIIIMAVCLGLLNAAIMFVNNTRDRLTDEQAGKRTLAVRVGSTMCSPVYRALVFGAYAIMVTAYFMGALHGLPVLLAGLSFVLGKKLTLDFETAKDTEFNAILHKTALLTFMFSSLYCIGLALT